MLSNANTPCHVQVSFNRHPSLHRQDLQTWQSQQDSVLYATRGGRSVKSTFSHQDFSRTHFLHCDLTFLGWCWRNHANQIRSTKGEKLIKKPIIMSAASRQTRNRGKRSLDVVKAWLPSRHDLGQQQTWPGTTTKDFQNKKLYGLIFYMSFILQL